MFVSVVFGCISILCVASAVCSLGWMYHEQEPEQFPLFGAGILVFGLVSAWFVTSSWAYYGVLTTALPREFTIWHVVSLVLGTLLGFAVIGLVRAMLIGLTRWIDGDDDPSTISQTEMKEV